MAKTMFKRAAAIAAAFIAIGSAAAVSIPAADAATTSPTMSHSVQHPGWYCYGYGGFCPHRWGGGGRGYPHYGGGYYYHYRGPHYWRG